MINNRQVGRRRGRNNPRQSGGGGGGGGNNRGNGDSGNRIDNRARGNAAQLLEKYRNLARDAQMAGDRVNVEYYLQFADHYFRVLADNRMRQEEQQGGRPRQSNDRDQYNGPESSDGDFMNDGMGDDLDDLSPRQQDSRQQEQRPRRDSSDEDMQPLQQDSRQQEQRPRRDQRDDDSQPRQQQDRRPRNDQRDDDAQPRQQEYRQQEQRPRRDQRDDESQPRQQEQRPRRDQRDDEAQPRQQEPRQNEPRQNEQRPRTVSRDEEAVPRVAEQRPRREPREKVPRVERIARPRPVNDDADNDGEVEIGLPGLPPSIARVEIDEPQISAEPAAYVAEAPVKPRRGRPPRRAAEAAE